MRAAMLGGNEIDVTLSDDVTRFDEPRHRPIDFLVRSFEVPNERLLGDGRLFLQLRGEIGR